MYEVLARKDPYEEEPDKDEVLKAIADPEIRKRPTIPSFLPDKIKALMQDCLDFSAFRRPSFNEINVRLARMDTEQCSVTHKIVQDQDTKSSLPDYINEALQQGRKVKSVHCNAVTLFVAEIEKLQDLLDIVGQDKVSVKLSLETSLRHIHPC